MTRISKFTVNVVWLFSLSAIDDKARKLREFLRNFTRNWTEDSWMAAHSMTLELWLMTVIYWTFFDSVLSSLELLSDDKMRRMTSMPGWYTAIALRINVKGNQYQLKWSSLNHDGWMRMNTSVNFNWRWIDSLASDWRNWFDIKQITFVQSWKCLWMHT